MQGDATAEEKAAAFRKKTCQPRKDKAPRDTVIGKDPSRGGSEGYSVPHRLLLIELYQTGHAVPTSNIRSIQRWIKSGPMPMRKTGNKATTSMGGLHLFLLAMFKRIYPQATNAQCAVFICHYSDDGRVFTDQEITQGLQKLDMTRKKGSTTAYQAFTPKNQYLHKCYWSMNYPGGGVNNVPRRRLGDADEMSFVIGDVSQSYGHAVKGCRLRKAGNYGRGKKKVTVIMMIEPGNPELESHKDGSIEKPRIWYRVSFDTGTSTESYKSFLKREFLKKIKKDEPSRVLLHDNLNSHKSPEIYDLMDKAGHGVLCRPPYRPNEAPIEWVFDQLACEVRRRWEIINNEYDLVREIRDVIDTRAGLGGFNDLFIKCGYGYDANVIVK